MYNEINEKSIKQRLIQIIILIDPILIYSI